ncbi:ras association domain-containing protein 1 isoform X2 [Heterocephalus glaber]|uniref:Ras association domain-containing protein 1 isoform X2 n=1 Tax=Heterocephalus glaber TaxID=10181 RepID=A0AAX6R6V3_HETGA|nr:ras association domain-containing protein 1 isoform X2 [Heterocephalus glaber]
MSTEPELIELRELVPTGRPGPGGSRLERANALRITPATAHKPARQQAPGRGHHFQSAGPTTHTWCDLCGDFIWGVVRKGLQCAHCKFTCHYRCRALVCLDCCGPRDLGWDPVLERDTNVDEPVEWETPDLSQAKLEQKIKEYNGQINSNLFMSLDARRGLGRGTAVRRRTSFYLPKDAVKHLHVLSRTRASEVIEALLRKFLVVDDPRKFALFERAERHGQVYFRKLSDDEQPLRLRLLAGPSEKALSFILKENDSGEVNTTVKNSSKDYSSKSLTSKSPDLALVIIISWLSLGRVCLLGHACCILCTSPHPLPVGCLQHARITQFSAHPAARGRRTPPTDPAEVLPLPPKDPRGPACLPPGVTCYIPGWQEESRQCQERAV